MTREEAIKILKYNSNVIHKTINGETDLNEVEALDMAIKALEQEPRKGHWIIHGEPPINVIECSECGQKYHNHYCQPLAHFCSMCGCRMVEPQEKEDKE